MLLKDKKENNNVKKRYGNRHFMLFLAFFLILFTTFAPEATLHTYNNSPKL